jgi:hypothetical protein
MRRLLAMACLILIVLLSGCTADKVSPTWQAGDDKPTDVSPGIVPAHPYFSWGGGRL